MDRRDLHVGTTHLRWAVLVLLLLAELLFLSLRFDTGALLRHDGTWAWLIGQSPVALRFGIVAIAAIFLFSAQQLADAFDEVSDDLYRAYPGWPLALAAHLVVLVLFSQITHLVIEGDLLASPLAASGAFLWLGVGLLAGVCWAGALARFEVLVRLLRKLRGLLLGGGVIGSTAVLSGWFAAGLWEPLGEMTLRVVATQLEFFLGEEVRLSGHDVIGTSRFTVSIAPSCSGYEGIGLIWVFFAAYIWLFRSQLRFPQVLALVPVATLVMWFANSIRITTLILIGNAGWPEVALGGFHSQAGWLAFCGVGLGLVVVSNRSRFFAADRTSSSATAAGRENVAAPYLVPFLAMLATAMVTGAFSTGEDALYFLRVVVVLVCFWMYRDAYREMQWSCSWQALGGGAVVAGLWLWFLPSPDSSGEVVSPGFTGYGAWLWGISRILGYVLTVPIAEELAFRGYLSRRLVDTEFQDVPQGTFTWFSWVGSGLLFGLMHGQYWLLGLGAGLLFALVYYRRGRIGDAVAAHATTNGLIAIYAAWSGDWSLLT